MDIREQDIDKDKTKIIGDLDGEPVTEMVLKGGLHLVCQPRAGRVQFLGFGPHRAVARYMAQKRNSRLKIKDLAKGDYTAPEHFLHLLPRWEALLDQMVALAARR